MPADPKNLTAWERWEMASLDAPDAAVRHNAPAAQTTQAPTAAVVLPTVQDVERIHQQAHDEGHRVGYEQGRQKVQIEADLLSGLVSHFETALTEFDQEVGEELLALAMEIARRVIEQEVKVKPEIVLDVVRHALAELPHQHAVLHLNPDDASLIRSYLGEQLTHAGHRIYEDPSLARGGCMIEAGGSQVDATLPTRWRRVLEGIGAPADWIRAEEK